MKKLLSLSINGKKIFTKNILYLKPESEKSGWEKIRTA